MAVGAISQLIILAIGLGLFFYVSFIDKTGLLESSILILFFIFASLAFDISSTQKIVLAIGTLYPLASRSLLKIDSQNVNTTLFDKKIIGLPYHIFTFVIGIAITILMFILSSVNNNLSLIGTPKLAITSAATSTQQITLLFAPLLSAGVGFMENRLFVTIFEIFNKFKEQFFFMFKFLGSAIIYLPIILTSFVFAILHIIAYNFVIGNLAWPFFMMLLWLGIYVSISNRDITHMDVSHGFWNGLRTAAQALTIGG